MQQTFDKLRPDFIKFFFVRKRREYNKKTSRIVGECHQEISNMAVNCAPFFVWPLDKKYIEIFYRGGVCTNQDILTKSGHTFTNSNSCFLL